MGRCARSRAKFDSLSSLPAAPELGEGGFEERARVRRSENGDFLRINSNTDDARGV